LKSLLKPVYNAAHDLLFDRMEYHPFFPKKVNGKKIRQGFISDEHLQNPALDDALEIALQQAGIETKKYTIDIPGYYQYVGEANYPASYYGGGFDPKNNFTEKTLEHFVSLSFLNLSSDKTFIDVAAATSPFFDIVKKKYGIKSAYRQDLVYPKGLHDEKIGGYAHEIPKDDASVDAVSLHCSLEHFVDESDISFFKTLERILKPGGRCVVLPFYIAGHYTIHLDPAFNLLHAHYPKLDPLAEIRYCKWKQYHSRHYDPAALRRRILDPCPALKLTVYRVQNFREVASSCYLRFIGVFEKQH
jgi:SAM-dependent methyltransferase